MICPYLGYKGQFTEDFKGDFYGNTKCFGLIKKENISQSYFYFLSLLNSELLWYFLKNTGTIFRGGYFAFTPDYLNGFGLFIPNKVQEQKIIALVDKILAGKEKGEDTTVLEKEIDYLVYRLYGLSYAEVKAIDPDFPLSPQEYESLA